MTAPARYSPSASEPAMASRAIRSTPASRLISPTTVVHASGTSPIHGRHGPRDVARRRGSPASHRMPPATIPTTETAEPQVRQVPGAPRPRRSRVHPVELGLQMQRHRRLVRRHVGPVPHHVAVDAGSDGSRRSWSTRSWSGRRSVDDSSNDVPSSAPSATSVSPIGCASVNSMRPASPGRRKPRSKWIGAPSRATSSPAGTTGTCRPRGRTSSPPRRRTDRSWGTRPCPRRATSPAGTRAVAGLGAVRVPRNRRYHPALWRARECPPADRTSARVPGVPRWCPATTRSGRPASVGRPAGRS